MRTSVAVAQPKRGDESQKKACIMMVCAEKASSLRREASKPTAAKPSS